MAIGNTGGTNPKLEIDITINDEKTKREFKKFQDKIEREAKTHEKNLKRITEKGDSQRKVVKGKFHDKLEAQEKAHKQKLRQIQELANQRTLLKQKAYQQKSLASQKSWSARMTTGLSSLVMGMKVFAAAYALMFIKSGISGAFNFADELMKTSNAIDISTEALQVYRQMWIEAGVDLDKTQKILNRLFISMQDTEDLMIQGGLRNLGINVETEGVQEAIDKIIQQIKDGTINISALVDVFGNRIARDINKIAKNVTKDFSTIRAELGASLLTDEQLKSVEKFNDVISRISTAIKIGFVRALSGPAGTFVETLDKLKDSIANINWEAVGQGIISFIKLTAAIGVAYTHLVQIIAVAKILGASNIWESVNKLAKGFAAAAISTGAFIATLRNLIKVRMLKALWEGPRLLFNILQKIFNFLPKLITPINKITGAWSKILLGVGKVLGVIKAFAKPLIFILSKLGKFGAFLGKLSVYLTVFFLILDVIKGLNNDMNIFEAILFSIAKLITDISDGLVWILSLGQIDLGFTNWLENLVGINSELEDTAEHFENIKKSAALEKVNTATFKLSNSFQHLSERLLELKSKVSLTSGEHLILKDITNQLTAGYSKWLGKINLEKDSFDAVKKAIEGATVALEEYVKQTIATAIINTMIKNVTNAGIALRENERAIRNNNSAMLEFIRTGINPLDGFKFDSSKPGAFERYIRENFVAAETALKEKGKELLNAYNKFYQEALDAGADFNKKNNFINFDEWLDKINTQIKAQGALREVTEKHIEQLKVLATQYEDNADVLALINKLLKEQESIITRLDINKRVLFPENISTDIKIKPILKLDIDFTTAEFKKKFEEIMVKDLENRFKNQPAFFKLAAQIELDAKLVNLQDLQNKLHGAEALLKDKLRFSIEGDVEVFRLQQSIKDLKAEIAGITPPPTGLFAGLEAEFEKVTESFLTTLAFARQVGDVTSDLVNSISDAAIQGLNNQMEVLQEMMRLENQRWSDQSARMKDSGIEGSAYYVKLRKEHERTLKVMEKKEGELKATTWDAEQQGKITQTIMNIASGIMAAFSAGPFIGVIMSAFIAATGAIQLAGIKSQKNPYRRAVGGWIGNQGDEKTDDKIPALLSSGEYIVNSKSAKANAGLLQNINNSNTTIQHFASGGLVRETASSLSNITNNTTNDKIINNNIYINVDGNLIDNTEWVENSLIPTINEAVRKGHQLETN